MRERGTWGLPAGGGDVGERGQQPDPAEEWTLVLPDGDPQQRRDLERTKWFQYRLYDDGGALLYSSPHLQVRETRREGDGAVVVVGSP